MASWEFAASEPIDAQIRIPDGSITVDAVPTQTVTVEIEPSHRALGSGDPLSVIRVEYEDGRLLIVDQGRSGLLKGRSFRFDVSVRLPEGSVCRVDTAAADVRCTGEVSTASGDVQLDTAGTAWVKSVSGDIGIGAAEGDASCESVSGDVRIRQVSSGLIDVKTTSGDIFVGVVPGICLEFDLATLSGDASSELDDSEPGDEATASVTCHSVSGDILVRRAARAQAG